MTTPTDKELEQLKHKAQVAHRELRARKPKLDDDSIDLILRDARSHYAWLDKPVPDELLESIYELTRAGPTSMNTCPARFIFVSISIFGKACRIYFHMRIDVDFLKIKRLISTTQRSETPRCKALTL